MRILALLLTMAATMALLVAVRRVSPSSVALVRYLAIFPVSLAAYDRNGTTAALAVAAFFIVPFVPEVAASYGAAGFDQSAAELAVFAVLISIFAFLSSSISAAFRTQRSLAGAVREQEGLLDRTSDPYQVAAYILEQARQVTDVEGAVLLLLSPIEERWEAIDGETRMAIPAAMRRPGQPISFSSWLLDQGGPRIMNDLEGDPRLIAPDVVDGQTLRSLLTQPIHAEDGTLAALLVLINSERGNFARRDLDALDALVTGAERALKQAGLYARTGKALARRASQLAALQEAARDLNTTLEQDWIVGRTLSFALEITGGEAGAAGAEVAGLNPSYRAKGVALVDRALLESIHGAIALERAVLSPPARIDLPRLLPDAQSRLIAPIRRASQSYGAVAVESPRARAFDAQDLLGMAVLASHAANALENARLFAEVRREREKSELIVETMADGLLTVDPDGRVMSLNPAAQALVGEGVPLAIGDRLCDVLGCRREPDCSPSCGLLQSIAQAKLYRDDRWTMRTPDGRERVLALSAAPMPALEGVEGGSVIQLRDVTAREELDRFQRELIAAFSHELRAPLTNINAIVSILSQEDHPPSTRLSREYLETLQKQTRRLSEFAERVLDVSNLDSGEWKVEARPLPLALIVEDRIREWQTLLPGRKLRADLAEKPGWIWADESAVGVVLDNLIDNAAKYSPEDSEIVVAVAKGPRGFRSVSVQDRGRGVPPEHRDKIFDRFYRADGSDSQDVYGYGLGLYIARKLVAAMGGEIRMESGPAEGSRFVFSLPVLSPQDPVLASGRGRNEMEE